MPPAVATVERDLASLTSGVAALCVGPRPARGALARLGAHGVRWQADSPLTALVFATVPTADAGAALRAARRLAVPLVLDLATPWALDGRREFRTAWHLRWARRAMQRAVCSADLLLVRTPALAAACLAMGAGRERVVVAPDGCDPAHAIAANPASSFVIHVASRLQPAVDPPRPTSDGWLRRRPRQIEPVGATGFYLFSALATLRQKSPAAFARVRVRCAHPLDISNREIVEWLGLGECVTAVGDGPTVADAVFVCQPGEVAATALDVPDELWRALASGRPLLAAMPPGPGRDLVTGLGVGQKLPPTDAPPLCLQIERLIAQKDASRLPPGLHADLRTMFGERAIAADLLRALQALAERQPLPASAHRLWPLASRH